MHSGYVSAWLGHHTKLCSVAAELDFADTGVSYRDILSGSSVPLAVDFSSSLQMSNINGRKTVDLMGFYWRTRCVLESRNGLSLVPQSP